MYEVKAIASFDHHGGRKVGDTFRVGSKRHAAELEKKGLVRVIGETEDAGDHSKPPAFSPELLERNAPEIIAWAGDVRDVDQITAALTAEREGKARKGVIEAFEKALAD